MEWNNSIIPNYMFASGEYKPFNFEVIKAILKEETVLIFQTNRRFS